MSEEGPTLRRTRSSSSSAASADVYDQAERGSSDLAITPPTATKPIEARKTLSFRYSLRSSDSTLVGINLDDDPIKQLPRQDGPQSSLLARLFGTLFAIVRSLCTLSFLRPRNTVLLPSHKYQAGYDQFKHEHYEDYPVGWPRVASFLDGCDSFSIYRRHGRIHSRLLITHMSNLADLEEQLDELDQRDHEGGPATSWRLRTRYHEEGLDTAKIEVMKKLETEVLAYDKLLLYHHRLKSLHQTPAKDHDNVFKWLWKWQPLDISEFKWIFKPNDFVSMIPPRGNRFEDFIRSHLDARPNSFLKRFCVAPKSPNDTSVEYFSTARISTFGRIMVVFVAVAVLFIPVILFLLTSMSRAWMAVIVLFFFFLFSGMISLLTEASVLEIFVGTATYCAVLVTFLGNLQGAPNGTK